MELELIAPPAVEAVSPPTAVESSASESSRDGCPMSGLLETLTRPWTFHILWQLGTKGPMRFGALRRAISGISARLLTVRLRALEAEGFVRRTVMGGKIPEVTYAPTARLADMNEVMEKLQRLSVKWREEDRGLPSATALRSALRGN